MDLTARHLAMVMAILLVRKASSVPVMPASLLTARWRPWSGANVSLQSTLAGTLDADAHLQMTAGQFDALLPLPSPEDAYIGGLSGVVGTVCRLSSRTGGSRGGAVAAAESGSGLRPVPHNVGGWMSAAPQVQKELCLQRAREVIETEIEGLRRVSAELGASFVSLVECCLVALNRGGKIVLSGVGKSGHIGHKIAATLASTGSPSVFLHPVEAMHGDLGLFTENDLLIALSYSGETDEVLCVLPAAKRLGVSVVAITGSAESRLAGWCDLTVLMPVPKEACPFNLAPTTSTTALLALGDALAIVLLQQRGFGASDYAKLHPGGAIGQSVTLSVADIMRTGDRSPCVAWDTPVREALVKMTGARCGCVAVVDSGRRLQGIFTDGDFRRHIMTDPNLLESPVGAVMTESPVTVRVDAMAIELLKILETRKIDDVLVVDGLGRAVGLVDVQDLARFKLV